MPNSSDISNFEQFTKVPPVKREAAAESKVKVVFALTLVTGQPVVVHFPFPDTDEGYRNAAAGIISDCVHYGATASIQNFATPGDIRLAMPFRTGTGRPELCWMFEENPIIQRAEPESYENLLARLAALLKEKQPLPYDPNEDVEGSAGDKLAQALSMEAGASMSIKGRA